MDAVRVFWSVGKPKKTAEPMCLNRELFIITIIKIWQATLFPVDVPESNSKQNWWLNMV